MSFRFSLAILICFLFIACSKEKEEGLSIARIVLHVDKTAALIDQDTFYLTAEVYDQGNNIISSDGLVFLANDEALSNSIFLPSKRGSYTFKAELEEIQSNEITVNAYSLEADIQQLNLRYPFPPYLTTEEWSVPYPFQIEAVLPHQSYPLTKEQVDFVVNENPITQKEAFHFSQPGDQVFQVKFQDVLSNQVTLNVRPPKSYPLIRIPVIFHSIGAEVKPGVLESLMDTINNTFYEPPFSRNKVLRGELNPNAVPLQIEFYLASTLPDGGVLPIAGLNTIFQSNEGFWRTTL